MRLKEDELRSFINGLFGRTMLLKNRFSRCFLCSGSRPKYIGSEILWYGTMVRSKSPRARKGSDLKLKPHHQIYQGTPKIFLLVFTLVNYMLRYIELVNRGLDRGLTYTVNLEV